MSKIGLSNTMANRDVCDLIFVDYSTRAPFLNLDYANVNTTELTSESVFAYGGSGHPKRVQFTGELGGTVTIETQMQSIKLWQLVTGGDVSKTAKFVVRKEIVTTDGTSVTLPEAPIAGTVMAYKIDDDCGDMIESTVTGTTMTLTTSVTANSTVVVYYMKEMVDKVHRINIKSTSFPKNFTVYAKTVMKTEDDDLLPYRWVAYKLAPQSNLSLAYANDGEPGTITITCDLLADKDNNLLDLILIEEE